ncbi:MAG: hypothetical protein C4529_08680 [Deltaproteobacteria bacterium]|nr:MAG: hypothetical protein C4529_08680 [Deltaproteobacteria bacterium]
MTLREALPAALLLLALASPQGADAAGLTESQGRGKRIYLEGKGRDPIRAALVGPGLKARGSGFPCVNCHRPDGKGIREGGVTSADITWFHLTKETTGPRTSGRVHVPYTGDALRNAVTGGRDPAGRELNGAHPRFDISPRDLDDLVAYLRILGNEPVPGVGDAEIRVGTLLPRNGPMAEAAREVASFLAAYFDGLSARGGIFARAVRFVPSWYDASRPGTAAEAARGIAAGDDVFCLLACAGVSAEDEAWGVLGRAGVPVVAPLIVPPESGHWIDRNTFYVYGSFRDQARVLVDYLADDLRAGKGKVAVVAAAGKASTGASEGAVEQAARRAVPVAATETYVPGAFDPEASVARLRGKGVDAVLFFGPGEDAGEFLRSAARAGWHPHFLTSAAMAGQTMASLGGNLSGKVALASPVASPDRGSREFADFEDAVAKTPGSGRHRSFQATAFAGAKLLEKGLSQAGRAATRGAFVSELGKLFAFRTGVTPPLSFHENRRVGAIGAMVLRIDPAGRGFIPAGGWREPK